VITLVTGAAGFIGMHLVRRLQQQEHDVVGIDNLGNGTGQPLKKDRLAVLSHHPDFRFFQIDLTDCGAVDALFETHSFSHVVHLAAQTGVRYSVENPHATVMNNIVAFSNVIENCRKHRISHLVYASSSSVYGANRRMPSSEHHPVDHPVSLYAATKRSNELAAHAYSHLHGLPTTGLRFFTVYGPWGRPDMAPMLFADAIYHGRPIRVFNNGKMLRDFTYVDDVVESIVRLMARPAKPDPGFDAGCPDPASSCAPYRIYNVGNRQPVDLMTFIAVLEHALGKKAEKIPCPMQPGDVIATCADTGELEEAIQWRPNTPLAEGIAQFAAWFRAHPHFSSRITPC
jgi:UDP-glucuronate 4-epimerase